MNKKEIALEEFRNSKTLNNPDDIKNRILRDFIIGSIDDLITNEYSLIRDHMRTALDAYDHIYKLELELIK